MALPSTKALQDVQRLFRQAGFTAHVTYEVIDALQLRNLQNVDRSLLPKVGAPSKANSQKHVLRCSANNNDNKLYHPDLCHPSNPALMVGEGYVRQEDVLDRETTDASGSLAEGVCTKKIHYWGECDTGRSKSKRNTNFILKNVSPSLCVPLTGMRAKIWLGEGVFVLRREEFTVPRDTPDSNNTPSNSTAAATATHTQLQQGLLLWSHQTRTIPPTSSF